MKIDHVEGAVLVGGQSSRMGRDKALVEWEGVPLVRRVYDVLDRCLTRVHVVVRPDQPAPLELPSIVDQGEAQAPMVGIHAALSACKRSAVLVASCDLPLLDWRVVLALLSMAPVSDGYDIVAPRTERGFEPLLAIYRPSLLPELELRIAANNFSLQSFLSDADTLAVPESQLRELDPELRSLHNVNRPKDLATLLP